MAQQLAQNKNNNQQKKYIHEPALMIQWMMWDTSKNGIGSRVKEASKQSNLMALFRGY